MLKAPMKATFFKTFRMSSLIAESPISQDGIRMHQVVIQNARIDAPPPNAAMFMPKTPVTKVNGRKMNAICVSRLMACCSFKPLCVSSMLRFVAWSVLSFLC